MKSTPKRIAAQSSALLKIGRRAPPNLPFATARIQAKGEIIALVRKKALDAIEDLAGHAGLPQNFDGARQ